MHGKDPRPYDGPIARADGVRPFNRYLWPTESWWAYDVFGHHGFSGRFHFGIIALNDGRWATDGFVWQIETDDNGQGQRVVFETREQAIRTAVARFIRLCRWAAKWDGSVDHLTPENSRRAINWALGIAKRPAVEFRPVAPPAPRPVVTGMPLFDHGASA